MSNLLFNTCWGQLKVKIITITITANNNNKSLSSTGMRPVAGSQLSIVFKQMAPDNHGIKILVSSRFV